MIITQEKTLCELARENLWCIDDKLEILSEDDWDALEIYFEMEFPGGIDLTELNDTIRFEDDFIANLLGFERWEELVKDRSEE